MAGHIPEELIQQILTRVNLVELIGAQLKLRQTGRNYVGLCPFHTDAKPSFSVNPEKGLYHCFGCHESGNAITYLTRSQGMSYREALEYLAQRTGVVLEYTAGDGQANRRTRDKKRQMLELNGTVLTWYRERLTGPEGAEARAYLHSRGITDTDVARFQIGCAPSGSALYEFLMARGYPLDIAEQVGVIARRTSGSMGDRFRQRLMFPIFNAASDVAGFSGRALTAEVQPKYMNSQESEVFKKGDLLFGLIQAREAIKKSGYALLVEGQIDALKLHCHGHNQAIAPLGTALTDSQCQILRRFTDTVILMYDGDEAGRKATWKSMQILMRNGLYGKIVDLPQGEDPDTLLANRGGPQLVEKLVKEALPFLEHALVILRTRARSTLHGRAQAASVGLDLAQHIQDDIAQGIFLDKLAAELEMPRDRLKGVATGHAQAPIAHSPKCHRLELRIVEALVAHPSLVRIFLDDATIGLIQTESVRTFCGLVLEAVEERGSLDSTWLLSSIEDVQFRDQVAGFLMGPESWKIDRATKVMNEALLGLKVERIHVEQTRLRELIRNAHLRGDADQELDLSQKLLDMQRELSNLRSAADREADLHAVEV